MLGGGGLTPQCEAAVLGGGYLHVRAPPPPPSKPRAVGPAGGFPVAAGSHVDIARSALFPLAPDRQPMSTGHPRTLLNLREGFPGCVIPRWLRGQPGQCARHPTPFLASLTPET